MANTVILLFLYILSSILFNAKQGLTIKLIHRDSPESPFYQPDRTQAQRTQKLILLFKSFIKHLRNERLQANFNSSSCKSRLSKGLYIHDGTSKSRHIHGMAQVSQGFNNLPTITFHLSGADLLLQPQAAFYVDISDEPSKREYFCQAMSSESDERQS
ncbi:hypothetical protein L3X38_019804 [Prunus dulcis]|uniref:Uncharacterized protein n=1 Tax=Prunus dulcis TaxID=3755 RepID=A0AAD4WBM0_PRUDU|nr:hypothetical protein L3X38_019804 [Prunus dulcis]